MWLDFAELKVSIPAYVNAVAFDQAAGRIPDPVLTTEVAHFGDGSHGPQRD